MGDAVVPLRSGSRCGLRSKVGVEKGAPVSSTCRIPRLTLYRTPDQTIGSLRSHGLAGQPARRPGGLEIEAAGDAVNVQQFTGKVQARANPAFHGLEIHLAQSHSPARHKFVLVQALARDREFRADQLLDELVLRSPPARSRENGGVESGHKT